MLYHVVRRVLELPEMIRAAIIAAIGPVSACAICLCSAAGQKYALIKLFVFHGRCTEGKS